MAKHRQYWGAHDRGTETLRLQGIAALALVLCATTSCGNRDDTGGGNGGAAGSVGTEPLCDGSDTIRFALSSAGGQVWPEYEFTNPLGFSYLLITGKCEAFALGHTAEEVRSAKLTPADADSVAASLGLAAIASWSGHTDQGCPDAGRISISDGKHTAWCSCGCDPDAPAGLADAIDKSFAWLDSVIAQGTPLSGPVACAADGDEAPNPSESPVAWPLSWPISQLPSATKPGGTIVDDPADAAALRALRASAVSNYPAYVPIDTAGVRYRLFLRDELRAGLAGAFAALFVP